MFKRLAISLMLVVSLFSVTACSNSSLPENTDRHVNLNGTWTSSDENIAFTATVNADRIKVDMKLRDTDGLYWAGTFNSLVNDSGDIVSNADQELLKSSMFGSVDKSKTFFYNDDAISFKFGMAGVEKTIRLTKGNVG